MGEHRADVVAKDGTVIELQHSPIDLQTLVERQEFYNKLIWVLDCQYYKIRDTVKDLISIFYEDKTTHIEFSPGRRYNYEGSYVNFYWKYPKRTFNCYSTARFQKQFFPVLLDIGIGTDGEGRLFLIRNVRTIDHWTGWGVLMTYNDFIWRVNESTNLALSLKIYNPNLKKMTAGAHLSLAGRTTTS